jgi:hypothetical protein
MASNLISDSFRKIECKINYLQTTGIVVSYESIRIVGEMDIRWNK